MMMRNFVNICLCLTLFTSIVDCSVLNRAEISDGNEDGESTAPESIDSIDIDVGKENKVEGEEEEKATQNINNVASLLISKILDTIEEPDISRAVSIFSDFEKNTESTLNIDEDDAAKTEEPETETETEDGDVKKDEDEDGNVDQAIPEPEKAIDIGDNIASLLISSILDKIMQSDNSTETSTSSDLENAIEKNPENDDDNKDEDKEQNETEKEAGSLTISGILDKIRNAEEQLSTILKDSSDKEDEDQDDQNEEGDDQNKDGILMMSEFLINNKDKESNESEIEDQDQKNNDNDGILKLSNLIINNKDDDNDNDEKPSNVIVISEVIPLNKNENVESDDSGNNEDQNENDDDNKKEGEVILISESVPNNEEDSTDILSDDNQNE